MNYKKNLQLKKQQEGLISNDHGSNLKGPLLETLEKEKQLFSELNEKNQHLNYKSQKSSIMRERIKKKEEEIRSLESILNQAGPKNSSNEPTVKISCEKIDKLSFLLNIEEPPAETFGEDMDELTIEHFHLSQRSSHKIVRSKGQ